MKVYASPFPNFDIVWSSFLVLTYSLYVFHGASLLLALVSLVVLLTALFALFTDTRVPPPGLTWILQSAFIGAFIYGGLFLLLSEITSYQGIYSVLAIVVLLYFGFQALNVSLMFVWSRARPPKIIYTERSLVLWIFLAAVMVLYWYVIKNGYESRHMLFFFYAFGACAADIYYRFKK
jgi:hypothetical protein